MQAKRKALVAVAAALLAGAAQAQQPQRTCFPSKHGPNDQVGNLNYVTPEKTLAAAKLVETSEMVKDQAWEFLFTLGPSRL
jgi:hypothetical protein